MRKYDFLIIGAGIVGLSVAKELTEKFPAATIALIEKEKEIGMHASGRNSGVLHSGIYYPQDSIKAQVCAEGARRMIDFAQEHRIACTKVGKVIIPTCEQQLPTLDILLTNAANNHVKAYRLDEYEIKKIEPHANVFQYGIHTPDTASIDSKAVLKKLFEIIYSRKVDIYLDHPLRSVNNTNNVILTSKDKFHFGYLFNCAGAGTDKIAKMFGLAKDYTLLPFKGIYYKLTPNKNHWVNGNIYPAPDLTLPFLGVHFTRTIHGDVYVGPTAIPAFGRENYGLIKGISRDAFPIVKNILSMYWSNQQNFRKLMHTEMKKNIKHYFVETAQQLISRISAQDLLTSNKVGIRPQLINVKKGMIEMDYIIEQSPHSLHVLNAISPAFTSALCFAELLVKKL